MNICFRYLDTLTKVSTEQDIPFQHFYVAAFMWLVPIRITNN